MPIRRAVSIASFEYFSCRPRFLLARIDAFHPGTVPETTSTSSQTVRLPRFLKSRLVLSPVSDAVGLLDVLGLLALETGHGASRVLLLGSIIPREPHLYTKARNEWNAFFLGVRPDFGQS